MTTPDPDTPIGYATITQARAAGAQGTDTEIAAALDSARVTIDRYCRDHFKPDPLGFVVPVDEWGQGWLPVIAYSVDTGDLAPDGRTALERLRMIPYDLLITDLKMPGVDGLAVIREARRLKADIPVIIITGFSTEASAIEAVNLGVSGYLTKPFRIPRVLSVAARALGE